MVWIIVVFVLQIWRCVKETILPNHCTFWEGSMEDFLEMGKEFCWYDVLFVVLSDVQHQVWKCRRNK